MEYEQRELISHTDRYQSAETWAFDDESHSRQHDISTTIQLFITFIQVCIGYLSEQPPFEQSLLHLRLQKHKRQPAGCCRVTPHETVHHATFHVNLMHK